MVLKKYTGYLFFTLLLVSCKSVQHISHADVTYKVMRADSTMTPDSAITKIIAPYKKQIDTVMNEVIGTMANDMYKQHPEGSLGNWVADVMLQSVANEGYPADFAIVNYGGLRLPSLPSGPVTRGKIFELSPFDNMVLVVDVPGNLLDSVFSKIASTGGWPVSKGVRLELTNKTLVSSMIHGQPIDSSKIYKVATLDYVANGGDDMKMLIPLKRVQTGKVLRDLLIADIQRLAAQDKTVSAYIEGRIINH